MNAAAKVIHENNIFTGEFTQLKFSLTFVLQLFFIAFVFINSLAVIYFTNLYRTFQSEYQIAEHKTYELNLQYGKLLLEQASLTTPARIQSMAVDKLNMKTPTEKQILISREK